MDLKLLSANFSNWLLLFFVLGIPLIAYLRKVNVYESFIIGAKGGFEIAIKIIPYLVAIIVAVGMFRAAGGFVLLVKLFAPLLNSLNFPSELLPLALTRPFSGSASMAILAEIAHVSGGDSFLAHAAATIMGSTETTFYVVSVYFGAVGIRHTRYAIPAGLLADLVGVIVAVVTTRLFF